MKRYRDPIYVVSAVCVLGGVSALYFVSIGDAFQEFLFVFGVLVAVSLLSPFAIAFVAKLMMGRDIMTTNRYMGLAAGGIFIASGCLLAYLFEVWFWRELVIALYTAYLFFPLFILSYGE